MTLSPEIAEWELLTRCILGDNQEASERAAQMLAERLGALAFSYFRRAGLSHQDAEDLAQDSTIRVITRLHQFDGRHFIGWAFTILRNLLVEHFRLINHRPPTLPLLDKDFEIEQHQCETTGFLSQVEHSSLEDVLGHLPLDDRTLLESQTGYQRMPFEKIAAELGITTGTARVRFHRIKQRVATDLMTDPRMESWLSRHTEQ